MSGLANFNPLSRASFVSREQEFHDIAIRAVDGYDNFGDPSYLEGLRRLLYSYDHESRLHKVGNMTAVYQTVGLLAAPPSPRILGGSDRLPPRPHRARHDVPSGQKHARVDPFHDA